MAMLFYLRKSIIMKKCIIISGGEFDIASDYKITEEDFVIACDKGYEYAKRLGIEPDLILGDFDSYEGRIDDSKDVLRYSSDKDDTDTMIAIKLAISKAYKRIDLLSSLGGRLDHLYANISSLRYALDKGVDCRIVGRDEIVRLVENGEIMLEKIDNFSLSIFSMSDISKGVSIKGAKYELDDFDITNALPIGISNEWVENTVKISVKEGILLIICSKIE